MPSFKGKRKYHYPMYGIMALCVLFLIIISFQRWWFGLIGALLLGTLIYFSLRTEEKKRQEVEEYISTLSHRVKKVGEEALLEMPVGIMLIDDQYEIEWTNPYMSSCFQQEETIVGHSLYDVNEELVPLIKQRVESAIVTLDERMFRVIFKLDERLLYFFDVTEEMKLENKYEEERNVIATVLLDNYDDATQGMDDQTKGELNSIVSSRLNKWAKDRGIFLKRVSTDRFITLFNEKILRELEEGKFSILDEVREATADQHIAITLSIGVGLGVPSLRELGELSQSSLDLALGRGGDQVAMKLPNGKLKFYGGKTNPMEKRTRVRARVISHALKDLMVESDNVVVMGHKNPDMDAIGAAIGIRKAAQMNHKEGYIVLNFAEIDTGVRRLLEEIKQKDPDLYSRVLTQEEAMEITTDNSLLVVVDTHKPSLVIEEKLLTKTDRIVVIDHHRRSEDFIQKPLLVYMEPYASSTSELVTELLEYQPKGEKINMLEATALLSGIIVDTKSFTLRTGSRTFDAASYLRSRGADTILVQKCLKENVDVYIKRSKLIETMKFYGEGIAIAHGSEDVTYNTVMIAQAADALLSMEGVSASFVVARREDDVVAISARSLGAVNVQIIMELLGGGGHLSNAATQLQDISVEEGVAQLKQVLDDYIEGGKSS